jgi:hypothetical protein
MRGASVCLLLAGLSQAVQVYLNPQPAVPPTLSPSQASFVLSRHFGLEFLESAGDDLHGELWNEQTFVGQGSRSGLLLTIDEVDARSMSLFNIATDR